MEASTKAGIEIPLPSSWSQIEVENWLMVHATAINADKPIHVDVDVFEQGFDRFVPTRSCDTPVRPKLDPPACHPRSSRTESSGP